MILSLIFLLGLAVANVFSIIFSAALDKKPNQVNEVSGLLIMGIAGGAIFPLLMGGISDLFGQTSGMAILLIPLLFLLFSTFYLKKETSQ
jgi:fucose permease